MKIDIKKFRLIIDQLFKFLEENDIKNIELEDDYYWDVFEPKIKYNPEINNEVIIKELGLGNLFDDWDLIQSISEREDYEIISSVTFNEVAEILKYIGFKSDNLIKDID